MNRMLKIPFRGANYCIVHYGKASEIFTPILSILCIDVHEELVSMSDHTVLI